MNSSDLSPQETSKINEGTLKNVQNENIHKKCSYCKQTLLNEHTFLCDECDYDVCETCVCICSCGIVQCKHCMQICKECSANTCYNCRRSKCNCAKNEVSDCYLKSKDNIQDDYCAICFYTLSYHTYLCEACGCDVCEETCTKQCSKCFNLLCKDCIQPCTKCFAEVCRDCVFICD